MPSVPLPEVLCSIPEPASPPVIDLEAIPSPVKRRQPEVVVIGDDDEATSPPMQHKRRAKRMCISSHLSLSHSLALSMRARFSKKNIYNTGSRPSGSCTTGTLSSHSSSSSSRPSTSAACGCVPSMCLLLPASNSANKYRRWRSSEQSVGSLPQATSSLRHSAVTSRDNNRKSAASSDAKVGDRSHRNHRFGRREGGHEERGSVAQAIGLYSDSSCCPTNGCDWRRYTNRYSDIFSFLYCSMSTLLCFLSLLRLQIYHLPYQTDQLDLGERLRLKRERLNMAENSLLVYFRDHLVWSSQFCFFFFVL